MPSSLSATSFRETLEQNIDEMERSSEDVILTAATTQWKDESLFPSPMPPMIPEGAPRIDVPGFPERIGKVRHSYDIGDRRLAIVASDRISSFDRIHPTGIPDKGKILTKLSAFWFAFAETLGIPHHLLSADADDIAQQCPALASHIEAIRDRCMLVMKGNIVPIEAIVRGYLAGSAWKEYKKNGAVCGIPLPPGLQESQELPQVLFTPSTKEENGHDVNIPYEEACRQVGKDVMEPMRDHAITLYDRARAFARDRGIIIADTKFEFMRLEGGQGLILADEILTPDSSRFWPIDQYEVGKSPPSFDKQFVRDFVEQLGWNKEPPAPELPAEIVEKTRSKYIQAYEQLTSRRFA